jgi:type II secretory pathway component PulF
MAKEAPIAALQRDVMRSHAWRLLIYEAIIARLELNTGVGATIASLAERRAQASPKSAETRVLRLWAEALGQGLPDHEVFDGFFPGMEIMLIRTAAARQSDAAIRGYERAAALVENRISRSQTFVKQLFYPLMLFCLLITAMLIIGYKVLPMISAMQTRAGNPPPVVLSFILTHAYLLPFPVWMVYFALRRSLPKSGGPVRVWLDLHLQPWTIYRDICASEFLFAFSQLWTGGLAEVDALTAIAADVSDWMAKRVLAIVNFVADGVPLGEAMASTGYSFPSPALIEMIRDIQAKPDQMARHLEKIARRQQKNLDDKIERIGQLMATMTMVLVVSLLITVLVSVFQSFDWSAIRGGVIRR